MMLKKPVNRTSAERPMIVLYVPKPVLKHEEGAHKFKDEYSNIDDEFS